jgi:peptide/nickel transport system substrate-binding protein
VAIDVADIAELHALSSVGFDQLQRVGLSVDVQTVDLGTWIRRRTSKEVLEKGGWNILFTLIDDSYNFTPIGNAAVTSTGPRRAILVG